METSRIITKRRKRPLKAARSDAYKLATERTLHEYNALDTKKIAITIGVRVKT